MLVWLFERIPFLEVWARIIYKKFLEWGIVKGRIIPNEKARNIESVELEELTKILRENGISKGNILIVHSSMKGIKGFGKSPDEIIDYLIDIVGEDGMLLMPAYPEYPEGDRKLVFDERYDDIYRYNVSETKAWTGLITNLFWKRGDVVRGNYPNNTLAAWGKDNEKPFEGELDTDLAYDKSSAWRYCVDRHAKVLFLGIHAHHSLSEIHIAEDYLDERLPVRGWYTKKRFEITTPSGQVMRECRVRKIFWTKYMAEYHGCYRLRKEGLLIEGQVGNINYSIVPDLYEFEKYVEDCVRRGDFLYFRIPKKYRIKR